MQKRLKKVESNSVQGLVLFLRRQARQSVWETFGSSRFWQELTEEEHLY